MAGIFAVHAESVLPVLLGRGSWQGSVEGRRSSHIIGSVTWLATQMGKEMLTTPAETGRYCRHLHTLKIRPAISGHRRPLKLHSCLTPATGRVGKVGQYKVLSKC